MGFLVILFSILKNAIYGLSVFFTGNLTNSIDILDLLALRFIISFLALFILKCTKLIKIEIGVKDIFCQTSRSKHMKTLLLTGIFEPVLYMFFETAGISMTTGITAGVILALSPIFSCICESVFLKEKSTFSKNIFLGIGIVGVIYIAANTNTSDGKNTVIGIIFVFLAVISGQMYAVFSRKSSKHFSTFEVTYITCALGAIVFNFINFVRHAVNGNLLHYFDPLFDINNLVGFLYLGILSTIIATAMNNYALSKVQVSSMAAFGGISTLTTIVADILLNGEKLYTFQIIGITLIFIRMVGASYLDIKKK